MGNPHIDIMKIDVEGHEFEVLRGVHRALSRSAIDIIGLEFGIHQVESRHFFRDFYRLFDDYGYVVHFIRGGALHEVTRYEYQYEDFTNNFQLVARRLHGPNHNGLRGEIPREKPEGFSTELWQSWQLDRNALRQCQSSLLGKEAEIVELRMALARLERIFRQSNSWKLTAPLRQLARLLMNKE